MEKKISIIVPIFNQYKGLKECLTSLLNQTYQNLEILVMDDGSSTPLPQELKTMIAEEKRICFWKLEHGGPSSTRNEGIKKATGDYILFCDSDDLLDAHALTACMEEITRHPSKQIDVLIFGFHLYRQGVFQEDVVADYYAGDQPFAKAAFYECYQKLLMNAPWNKLINRELLLDNHLSFNEGQHILEDLAFSLDVVSHAKEIIVLDQAFYHYFFMESGSLSSRLHEEKGRYLIETCYQVLEYTKEFPQHHNEYCKICLMKLVYHFKTIMQAQGYSMKEKVQLIKTVLQMKELKLILTMAQGRTFKEKIKIRGTKLLTAWVVHV